MNGVQATKADEPIAADLWINIPSQHANSIIDQV